MFIGIHNHTALGSNLRQRDSTNRIPDMIEYAHELGHRGIVFTEHESITSHLDVLKYYQKVKDKEGWEGFKVGLGNEVYLCPSHVTKENAAENIYPHFILIALDAEGHKAIRELSTNAWVNNSFMSVMYRVPTYYSDLEDALNKYHGHLVGSSACLGGSLPRKLLEYRKRPNDDSLWGEMVDWIDWMNEMFGQGYFFLELQPGLTDEQMYVNRMLIRLSKETGTPYLISTDAHYLKQEDRKVHEAFLNADEGDREVDSFYECTYIMSEEEIHQRMDDYLGHDAVQQGLDNTMLVYDKLQDYSLTKSLYIPYMPLLQKEPEEKLQKKYLNKIRHLAELAESQYDSDRNMVRKLLEGIEKNPHYQTQRGYDAVSECLDYLVSSSDKMNVRWSAYLMQVSDYVKLAWEAGTLVGPARGSGAGFCLLYLLDICQVDPLREKTKLYPWRFLNPERASVLDIDTDIESNARDAVIQKFRDTYGELRVSKVLTLTTEKTRSAILTAARGIGLDNDTASYIASLIVFDRGMPRTLKQMYYGDPENDIKPVPEFITEMDRYPELWETAQKIEGLVSGYGSHAGGIIMVDEPFTESAALMRTKDGDIITQFDLHDAEDCSLIKIDLLSIDALDKIHATLNLLLKDGLIEWQGDLRSTYEKYLGIYRIERDDPKMWELLANHKVISAFQMEKESGKQALALVKPRSVDDLATINSVIRLMPQDKNAEMPLKKYARYHENIQLWYDEMTEYGLTEEEQNLLNEVLHISCGICEAQEYLVALTRKPEIGGFSLGWGDRLRKAVAKKNPKDFDQQEHEFFENARAKGLSEKLTNYVWYQLIYTQRGYSFNRSHTLSYSLLLLQELNLCYKYDPIYWQTANLIVDSGSSDETSNDSTNYGKMGIAIATIQKEGVRIALPTLNEAEFGFKPDTENEQIIFGLKGINSINTETAQILIQNAPYSSLADFANKMLETNIIKPAQMVMLIKGGCFTKIHSPNRSETLDWYLRNYQFTETNKLGLAQVNRMKEMGIIPDTFKLNARMVDFKKYVLDDEGLYEKHIEEGKKMVKRGYHDGWYILDNNSQPFFKEHFSEDSVRKVVNGYYVVSEKAFTKEVDNRYIAPLKVWFESEEAKTLYNFTAFLQVWEKYGLGTEASWNMQALCYYDGKHELDGLDEKKYGVSNFFEMPEEPVAYDYYTRWVNGEPRKMPKYTICRIAGTVLNADNNHHTVALLTKYGLVNVKMNKGHYAFYNKRISARLDKDSDKKTVLEDSWLKRGNKLIISGIRRGDQFFPLIYQDTVYQHTVNKIDEINTDGSVVLLAERTKVED